MSEKNRDDKNRWRNVTIAFRMSSEENEELNNRVRLSGFRYDALQYAYADMLEVDNDIVEIRCNIQLECMDYTFDFLCVKANGEYMVRECVYRKLLQRMYYLKCSDSEIWSILPGLNCLIM